MARFGQYVYPHIPWYNLALDIPIGLNTAGCRLYFRNSRLLDYLALAQIRRIEQLTEKDLFSHRFDNGSLHGFAPLFSRLDG